MGLDTKYIPKIIEQIMISKILSTTTVPIKKPFLISSFCARKRGFAISPSLPGKMKLTVKPMALAANRLYRLTPLFSYLIRYCQRIARVKRCVGANRRARTRYFTLTFVMLARTTFQSTLLKKKKYKTQC